MKKIALVTILSIIALHILAQFVEMPKSYSINGETNRAVSEIIGAAE